MKQHTIIYICALLMLAGCAKDEMEFDGFSASKTPRYIDVTPKELTLSSAGGVSGVLKVSAENTAWQFSGQVASWLTMKPSSGDSDKIISMTATENLSGDKMRTSIFAFSTTTPEFKYTTDVKVTQRTAEPYLKSVSSINMSATEETRTINVSSNISYKVSKSPGAQWLTVTPKENNTKLEIKTTVNNSIKPRTATITLSGVLTRVITVTQSGAGISSDVPELITVENRGRTYSMQIKSDVAWTASTNGSSWFTISPMQGAAGTSTVALSVSPNHSTEKRSGCLLFKIGTDEALNVKIEQSGLYITTSLSSLAFGANSSSRQIDILSNIEWRIISMPAWITASDTAGVDNHSLTFTATEHTGEGERSGSIVIGKEGVTGLQKTINVIQAEHYFDITPTTPASLPSAGGIHNVSIATDEAWSITKNAPWLTLSSNSGFGNIDVTMTIADNPSVRERSDTVVFAPTYKKVVKITTKQAGRYLTVDTRKISFYYSGGESTPIAITTDGTCDVTTNDDWLRIVRYGNSFTVTANSNESKEERTAIVTVALTGLVEGDSLCIEIPVVQRGNRPITIDTFPDDLNWNIHDGTHAKVTITGFGPDEDWGNTNGTSFSVKVTSFDSDDDWNP